MSSPYNDLIHLLLKTKTGGHVIFRLPVVIIRLYDVLYPDPDHDDI
jgi:hypothetical protein